MKNFVIDLISEANEIVELLSTQKKETVKNQELESPEKVVIHPIEYLITKFNRLAQIRVALTNHIEPSELSQIIPSEFTTYTFSHGHYETTFAFDEPSQQYKRVYRTN